MALPAPKESARRFIAPFVASLVAFVVAGAALGSYAAGGVNRFRGLAASALADGAAVSVGDVTGHPTRQLDVTGLFVFVGFTPNTHLVASRHVEHDAAGYFVTNSRMETSAPGLFAVGDVRSQLVRQITKAVGDATTAAIAVERYITELKQQRAVAGVSAELHHKYI